MTRIREVHRSRLVEPGRTPWRHAASLVAASLLTTVTLGSYSSAQVVARTPEVVVSDRLASEAAPAPYEAGIDPFEASAGVVAPQAAVTPRRLAQRTHAVRQTSAGTPHTAVSTAMANSRGPWQATAMQSPTAAQASVIYDEGDSYAGPLYDEGFPWDESFTSPSGSTFGGGHFWVRPEVMLSWIQRPRLPSLVTTSPQGTVRADAGVLGDNFVDTLNTQTLFGGRREGDAYGTGGKISLGWWTDQEETLGILGSYFVTEEISTEYSATSTGNPILARPFFSVQPPTGSARQASSLLAFPGEQTGVINITGGVQVYGADVYLQENWFRGNNENLDMLYGYRFFRVDDFLQINDNITFQSNVNQAPIGTTIATQDRFTTRNIFHGGEIGGDWQRLFGVWTLESAFKLALGNVTQNATIAGSGITTVPSGQSATVDGGLLALTSNSGRFERDRFAALLDYRAGIGYHWSPRLKLDVAYNIMYINKVARAANLIDLNVNDTQIGGPITGPSRPAFAFRDTDLWVQGVTIGIEYRH